MTDWQRDLDEARAIIEDLTRERDEARATIERMKPVVDMALYRWRYCRRRRSFEANTMLDYVEATERVTGVRP
jgi:hypothetical protein